MKKIRLRLKAIYSYVGLGLLTFLIVAISSHAPSNAISPMPNSEVKTEVFPTSGALNTEVFTRKEAEVLAARGMEWGRNLYEAGRLADAVSAWQQAARGFELEGDRLSQALTLNYISLAYQDLGRLDRAQEAIDQSQKLLAEQGVVLPQVLNTRGSLQLARGQTEAALETWQEAESAYTKMGDEAGRLGSLINQAGAMQALGQYRRARIVLERLKTELEDKPNSQVKLTGLHSLGIALQVVGDLEQSRQVLEESLQMIQQLEATGLSQSGEKSAILFSLGNTARALAENDVALYYYQQAAEGTKGAISKVEAELNQLDLLIDTEQWENARALLPQIESRLANINPSRMSVYARANFAQNLMNLETKSNPTANPNLAPENSEFSVLVSRILAVAIREARQLQDSRAESYALGQLGNLYERTQQWAESRSLTEQALLIAQSINASDIVPRWQWQLGRVLKEQGNVTGAIAAYSEAVSTLKSLRSDLTAIAPDVQFSFRESVEPIYRQLVDLLLQPSEGQVSKKNLQQARETIELLQLAELDNFFRNACLQPQPEQIDRVDPTAATIYPIILPNRLAVILSLPGQPLEYYETIASEEKINLGIRNVLQSLNPIFSDKLRLQFSQQIYDWLIRPAEADLANSGVQTLVFIMDGPLRSLPAGVLYDGERYLIEKYSIALTPGLQLLEPRSISPEEFATLTGGLTEARQGFSALPAVESEVNEIATQIKSEVFLNSDFTANNLQKQIKALPFPVVHLATHGQFSSNSEETFILTWDEKIQVEDFRKLLFSRGQKIANPVELLVLSACQTAQGDERAALGLAGIAVRSGARSTVASLWAVNDESTSRLMAEFYRKLAKSSGVAKAEALRQAQITLLQEDSYKHPYFWSSFVLVGNWL